MYNQIKIKLEEHNKLSRIYKLKHTIYGLPPLLVPLFCGCLIQIMDNEHNIRIVSSIGFLLTGVCSSIYRFLNLSQLSERHNNFASFYNNLINKIENKKLTEEEIRIELYYLDLFSPDTNYFCCFK